jgi:2-polyprenyl-6-methoxyphenol hydroxylase-like FAD-dependent oxidoreductase
VDQARINDRSSSILTANFAYLASYTRYPYALLLPQNVTEHVLGEQLNNIGVRVFRPFRVTAVRNNEQEAGILDVSFEGGEVIQASYVIGADGARSTVRLRFCTLWANRHYLPNHTDPSIGWYWLRRP